MISEKELDELYERVESISEAKYNGRGSISSISYEAGTFNVTFETYSGCGCCSNDYDDVEVYYSELTQDLDTIIKSFEEKKAKEKADALKRLEEQKAKDAKAKLSREMAELKRLQLKFNSNDK